MRKLSSASISYNEKKCYDDGIDSLIKNENLRLMRKPEKIKIISYK